MEGLYEDQIAGHLLAPASGQQPAAQRLVQHSLECGGGGDNITALVVELV
jgi:serine/threonine protein phosphatase PrpC